MTARLRIKNTQIIINKIHAVNIEPFFSSETADKCNAWNSKLADLRNEVNEIGESMNALISEASSGSCTRPATIISEAAKAKAKALKLEIELINRLTEKGELWQIVKSEYVAELKNCTAATQKRLEELKQLSAGMDQRAAASVRVYDAKRKECEDRTSSIRAKTQESGNIMSNQEKQILAELQMACADL